MSVAGPNYQYSTGLKWPDDSSGDVVDGGVLVPAVAAAAVGEPDTLSSNVDDGLTSLSWLQNLNMCMTRLGAPTPPTPPASPICFGFGGYSTTKSDPSSTLHSPTTSSKFKGGAPYGATTTSSSNCLAKNTTTSAAAAAVANRSNQKSSTEPSQSATANRPTAGKRKSGQQGKTSAKYKKCSQEECSELEATSQPEQEIVDYRTTGNIKPPYSYASLICMAMKANKNKMTLSSIYKWIKENFLYYRNADPSWQV